MYTLTTQWAMCGSHGTTSPLSPQSMRVKHAAEYVLVHVLECALALRIVHVHVRDVTSSMTACQSRASAEVSLARPASGRRCRRARMPLAAPGPLSRTNFAGGVGGCLEEASTWVLGAREVGKTREPVAQRPAADLLPRWGQAPQGRAS